MARVESDLYGDGLVDSLPTGKPGVTKYARADKLITDQDIRCQALTKPDPENPGQRIACGRLLAKYASRPWLITCSRCKHVNQSPS